MKRYYLINKHLLHELPKRDHKGYSFPILSTRSGHTVLANKDRRRLKSIFFSYKMYTV